MKVFWGMAAVGLLSLTVCSGVPRAQTASPQPIQPATSAPATLTRVTSPAPMATPSPPPTLVGSRSLYEFHAGATVVLHTGESVRVALGADYVVPRAHGTALSLTSATGGFPTGLDVEATFTAVRPGRAELEGGTDYACRHVQPQCARPQMTWQIHIVVS